MLRITEPLRQEHKQLLPHIEALRAVGDSVGEMPPEALRRAVGEAQRFLVSHLIPHARAEDQVLYPAVERLMEAAGATATMSRDHVEVVRLTEQLTHIFQNMPGGGPTASQGKALRRVLYGLYALVSVHIAKEEEIYLPLLDDRLTAAEARGLFGQMEEAAKAARHTAANVS